MQLAYSSSIGLGQEWNAQPARRADASQPIAHAARGSTALLMRALLRIYNRPHILGREHLPLGRSFVIVANHASHLDTVCLQSALPLAKVHQTFAAAAADYFFGGTASRAAAARILANAVPFARHGSAVRGCLARCRALLDDPHARNILIVYPEGTRSTDGTIAAFKRGIGDLVAGRDLPVVPCHIDGTFRAWPKGAWFPRPCRVRLTFGPPRSYARFDRSKRSAQTICQDLRRAVIELSRADTAAASAANHSHILENVGSISRGVFPT